ncbi:MAG: alpha/beta hydrolase [Armatimonadota bacterium]|nr:alpha/beta hydrolase [Armatimonadota bacterium]MDR5703025.1 alpha/beta hydrolase [Armatimonadota bacterium]MDR7434199.1 alpha/beta hydrolase [Armatimonadota bacterium]
MSGKYPRLLLIHGSGGRGQIWQYQLLAFPGAEAPDLPGHPYGKGCSRVEEYVEWIREYIQSRAWGQVVLGGHSLGGAIALGYALTYPGDLHGLILVGTGARLRVRQEFLSGLIEDYARTVEELLGWLFGPGADPRVVEKTRQVLRETQPEVTHGDFLACHGFDVMDRVGEIRVPTLVICGAEDRMTPPKYSEYLHAHIPNSRLVIVTGAGHMVMLEQPEKVNEAIGEFLETLK